MFPRLRLFVVACAVMLALSLSGGHRAAADDGWREPPSTPVADYILSAELTTLPGEQYPRRLKGTERLFWVNTGSQPVGVLYFHLYANAFRSTRSTFIREFLRDGGELPEDMAFGGIDVQQIDAIGQNRVSLEYVQPDDGNADDRTVARVKLAQPVPAGGQIALKLEFTTTFPRAFRRMGAWREFVFGAQWYPKLGRFLGTDSRTPNVHEGWYCHQYHSGPEFCADFANYDVTLTLPTSWTSGATGERVPPDPASPPPIAPVAGAETRTERWLARGVVDFAWTAGRRFEERTRVMKFPATSLPTTGDRVDDERRRMQSFLNLDEKDLVQPPVEVVLLLQPEHLDQTERCFDAARVGATQQSSQVDKVALRNVGRNQAEIASRWNQVVRPCISALEFDEHLPQAAAFGDVIGVQGRAACGSGLPDRRIDAPLFCHCLE